MPVFCRRRLRPPIIGTCADRSQPIGGRSPLLQQNQGNPLRCEPAPSADHRHACRSRSYHRGTGSCRFFVGGGSVRRSSARVPIAVNPSGDGAPSYSQTSSRGCFRPIVGCGSSQTGRTRGEHARRTHDSGLSTRYGFRVLMTSLRRTRCLPSSRGHQGAGVGLATSVRKAGIWSSGRRRASNVPCVPTGIGPPAARPRSRSSSRSDRSVASCSMARTRSRGEVPSA